MSYPQINTPTVVVAALVNQLPGGTLYSPYLVDPPKAGCMRNVANCIVNPTPIPIQVPSTAISSHQVTLRVVLGCDRLQQHEGVRKQFTSGAHANTKLCRCTHPRTNPVGLNGVGAYPPGGMGWMMTDTQSLDVSREACPDDRGDVRVAEVVSTTGCPTAANHEGAALTAHDTRNAPHNVRSRQMILPMWLFVLPSWGQKMQRLASVAIAPFKRSFTSIQRFEVR